MSDNQDSWSDWVDFNQASISNIPQSSGVFMMHSSMKILFIEGTKNIKKSIQEKFSHPTISENTRLRFIETGNFEKISNKLIRDYRNRHEGNLPFGMQE